MDEKKAISEVTPQANSQHDNSSGIVADVKTDLRDVDDALLFVHQNEAGELSPEEDRRLLRKIDLRLMPMVSTAERPVLLQSANRPPDAHLLYSQLHGQTSNGILCKFWSHGG